MTSSVLVYPPRNRYMSFARLDKRIPFHSPASCWDLYLLTNSLSVKVEEQRRLEVFAAQGHLHTELCADEVSFQLTKSTVPSRAEEALHLQDDQFIHTRHPSDVIGLGTYWADFYHSFLSHEQTLRTGMDLPLLIDSFSLSHNTHILTPINIKHSQAKYNIHSLVLNTRYNHERRKLVTIISGSC